MTVVESLSSASLRVNLVLPFGSRTSALWSATMISWTAMTVPAGMSASDLVHVTGVVVVVVVRAGAGGGGWKEGVGNRGRRGAMFRMVFGCNTQYQHWYVKASSALTNLESVRQSLQEAPHSG